MDRPEKTTQGQTPADRHAIARQLTGELFCIGCGYNLRGLSIRSNCSECGIPVRATILGIVDPHAEELAPLIAPRLVALGLNLWSIGAFLAVFVVWMLWLAQFFPNTPDIDRIVRIVPWFGMGGLAISMLGGASMIRPHRSIKRLEAIRAAIGVSLYAPLILVYSELYLGIGLNSGLGISLGNDSIGKSVLRILLFVMTAGIVWALRPAAVGLAIRSVVVRTGRVDRQSLLAVLGAMGIGALGDVVHLITLALSRGMLHEALSMGSMVLLALGSVLFTLGLANICIDTLRLYPVLIRPGVGIGDIFETNQERNRRVSSP